MQKLYQEGILDAPSDELRSRYLAKVIPVLQNVGLSMPVTYNETTHMWVPTEPLPWSHWDATARRRQGEQGVMNETRTLRFVILHRVIYL